MRAAAGPGTLQWGFPSVSREGARLPVPSPHPRNRQTGLAGPRPRGLAPHCVNHLRPLPCWRAA